MGREKYWSRSFRKDDKESVGCMTGVLQLFDFHHHQQLDTDSLQGLEAPRNSLEFELQIQCLPKSTEKDSSSDTSSLQGSKTPNLVARLMGLDILPDQASSPPMYRRSLSSHLRPLKIRDNTEMGTRSLPDTPRMSAARRSDVDPRLSLQISKENLEMPEFSYFSRSVSRGSISSPCSSKKKKNMENKSPRAREIVKKMKERVRRRAGMDITNLSCRNRSCDDESGKKTKRMSRLCAESKRSGQQSTSSWSPRLRYLESKIKRIENKEPISVSISDSPKTSSAKSYQSSSTSSMPSTSRTLESLLRKESEEAKPKPVPKSTTKCRKANCERFTQRAKATNSSLQTARKKCKTSFANTLLLQSHPSSNATESPLQTVVSSTLPSASSPHHQYDQEDKPPQQPNPPHPLDLDNSSIPTTLSDPAAELLYVTAILDRTIVSREYPTVPFTSWFSPSHPLDPSLFHHLEHSLESSSSFSDGSLNLKSNRRLLFDLVDEILQTTVKLHLMMKPWLYGKKPTAFKKEQLLKQVGSKVGGFGSAKCETLHDIDGLVDLEPWEANVSGGGCGRGRCCCYSAVYEEREAVVFEMERRILESLVEEALILL